MSAGATHVPARPADTVRRWGASLAAVLSVHATLVAALLWWQNRPAPPAPPMPAAAVMVELAPLPTAPPAPPTELPPGPPQQAQRRQALPQPVQPPTPEPPPPPTQVANVALPLPQPPTPVDTPAHDPFDVAQTTAPPSVAATPDARYAARQTLSGAAVQAAVVSWQSQVLGHLQAYKRYPGTAQRRRLQGVSQVHFAVDRRGRVLDVRIEHGSGHAVLDAEAVATLRRASPLPAPPDAIPGDPVEVSTPVDFFIR